MRWIGIFLAALFVLATSGCAQRVDVEAERAAISDIPIEWSIAAEAKDVERMVALYSDDASVLPPNAPPATGKEAIRKLWSQMVESPGFAGSAQTTKLELSRAGDLAYSVGTYVLKKNDLQGNPSTERGKWVLVCKKQPDGTWKVVIDIWNSDRPAASE